MNDSVILKIFSSHDGKRKFKPDSQNRCISVTDAQKYIAEKNLFYYDLLVNGKIIDRDGRGTPGKAPKKDKSKEIRIITITNEKKVLDFIKSETGIEPKNFYPFKKNDNNFAIEFNGKEDANKVWRYLNNSPLFTILQLNAANFALSFSVSSNQFNENIKWEPTALPQTSIISSIQTQITDILSSSTWDQLQAIMQ
jgi:hypothetical protein